MTEISFINGFLTWQKFWNSMIKFVKLTWWLRLDGTFFRQINNFNFYLISRDSLSNGNHRILLPRFFSQKFRQINVLLKMNFTINWFDGKRIAWRRQWISRFSTLTLCTVRKCDLVPHIFGKNFVKVTFLLKKLLKS